MTRKVSEPDEDSPDPGGRGGSHDDDRLQKCKWKAVKRMQTDPRAEANHLPAVKATPSLLLPP
jgi:hypothetical protein